MLPSSSPKNRTIVRSQNAVRLTRVALQAAYVLSEDFGTGLAERLFTSPRRFSRPERERALLASARPFSVEVALRSPRTAGQRVELAAWRWGHGPTVLLVHGWEGRGSQLGSFVEPLVAAGMSVVAFDAPAHGDTAGHRLYLTDHADAVAAVAGAIGPLHAVIAHSFGAAAVLLAHARGGVDALRNVLISPNVFVEDSFERFSRTLGLDDADRSLLEHHVALSSGIALDSLRLDRLAGARDSGLLVVHDREDREVAFEQGEQLAETWPNAQLQATTGLGHRRILRDPSVIDAAVAFVRHGVHPPASDLVREVDRYFSEHDPAI